MYKKNLIRALSNLFGFGKSFNNLENLSVFSNHTPHKIIKLKQLYLIHYHILKNILTACPI